MIILLFSFGHNLKVIVSKAYTQHCELIHILYNNAYKQHVKAYSKWIKQYLFFLKYNERGRSCIYYFKQK